MPFMAFGKYKSSGGAPPSVAPLNFSRQMLDHGQSAELEIAAGPSTEADVDIDVREVYFLIMHFLSSGPCARTFVQIWNELLEHDLLPRRYHAWYSRNGAPSGDENDNGHSLPLNYQSLVERNPHIKSDHLVKLMKQLILCCSPPLNRFSGGSFPSAADVPTLLGSGSFSLLGSDKNRELKKVNHLPQYLRWPHMHADQVRGLSLREIGGGFAKHCRSPSIRAACYAVAKPSTMVQKMQVIRKLRGHQNAVYCAIFDRSGRYVITGSDDRLVKIWSMETAFCLSSCRGHEGDITDLAVSANNALVASASNDFIIRVWRLPDGLPISILRGHTAAVTAIAFSPRPNSVYQLLSSSDDGTCRIWDARYSQCSPRVYVPKPPDVMTGRSNNPTLNSSPQVPQILCCAFNASGTVFVTGSSDTYARVWNACKTSQEDSELPNHEMDLLSGHENDVNYVQFSGCAVSSKLTTIDISKEDNMPKFKNSWFIHDNIVTCSRDGSAIIWIPRSRRSHGKVGRWTRAYHLKVPPPPMPPQPPRGGPRQRFQPTPRGVNMIVWSLDNRFVLATIMDCRICVWNASDGSLVHSLIGHTESAFVLDVHPFNPRIAMSAGYDGKTIIWDIWEGIPVRIYETGRFKLVDGKFSPDGTSVVLSDEVGQIFIIATGQGESQKDAQYDQFFLGDYRPLIQDAQGNVLDQETQLAPYRRNMQDLLCDSNMIPYPEPYQSMYQRWRLGALGIEWQPSSLKFAVGPSNNVNGGDFQILQIVDLERWIDPQPEFLDAMDFEIENEVQSDDNDSEYNINEEYSSEGEHGSVSISSTVDPECSAEESEAEYSNQESLRRSKRKKLKIEAEFTTSSGRRVKRRNLDQHDESVIKRHKKKRKRNGNLASKKKSSKTRPHRPQRRAARNALTFLSQMGEVSTEGEYEDESETYSSENDSIFQESNTHSNDSESSMLNTHIEHTNEKQFENEVIAEPRLHDEAHVNAGVKRKLVLRLPIRDSKKTIFPESTRNGTNEKDDGITSPTKKNFDSSPEKIYSSYYEPGQASGNDLGYLLSQNDIGCKIAGEHNENIGNQLLSSGYKDGKVKWGEVKTRTSKRIRVSDGIIADPCIVSNSYFEGSGSNINNSNGHVKLEIEHGTIPRNQFSVDDSNKRNNENEEKLNFNSLPDNLDGEKNQESIPGYAHQLSEFDQSSQDPSYANRSESKEKDTDEFAFTGSKDFMASNEHHGVSGRHDTKTSIDNLQDIENNDQPICKKLKFKSKISMHDHGCSSSKLSLVDDHKASGMLSYNPIGAEHKNISMTHEDDANSSGSSDIGDWNTQSRQRDKNGIYVGGCKSLTINRERKLSRGTHGLEEHLSKYDDINDGHNAAFSGSMLNGHHHTRSLGKRAIAEKSFTINDTFTMRGGHDYAETSKTRLKFSLNGCDPQPASKMTVGLRSARNRRENYNYHDLGYMDKRKARRSAKKLSWLMLLEHEEGYRYIPQLDDEVAYLRQGHEEYLDAIKSHEFGPWKIIKGDIKAVEFCKVNSLEYSTLPGSGESCCKLTLEFTDPISCAFGKAFKLTLPELVEFPDFIVERTRYDASIERNWTSRDKCQVWWRNEDGEGGSWWEGRIISVKSKSSEFPESPWERYVIQYRNDSSGQHLHSPWELHDADTPWDHPHIDEMSRDKLLSSFEKMEQMSMRNQDNLGLQKLDQVSQKSDFLNRFPVPLSLEVIKARLENNYYRTLGAVRHDTSVMISNAQTYFAKSAEFASKIRRLSELIVRALPS